MHGSLIKSEQLSGLYQCQFPGCDVILWSYKTTLEKETAEGYMVLTFLFLTTACEPTVTSSGF